MLLARLAGGGGLALLALSLLPPVPGRLGQVTPGMFVVLAVTGVGGEGSVPTSYGDRMDWMNTTLDKVTTTPLGPVLGVGFGEDLTGGFGLEGIEVVNPHNDFLEVYARLGAMAVPWFLLWAVVLRVLGRVARQGDRLAAWGLTAASVAVFVSLTQPFSAFAYGGLVWWMLAGIVVGTVRRDQLRTGVTDRSGS
jgi:hypothetical protein